MPRCGAKLLQAEARLPVLQQRLKRTTAIAPVGQQVVDHELHTQGTVVQPGKPLLRIAPLKEGLIVEARVPPKDVDHVAAGPVVRLRFRALDGGTGKPVKGNLASVSADTIRQRQDGERYYLSRIRLSAESLERLRQTAPTLEAGMPVTAMIQTGKRTFCQYITEPIREMIAHSLREP